MINGSATLEENQTISDDFQTEKRGNIVFRQELQSLTPKCNINCVLVFYTILMMFFLVIGIPIVLTGNQISNFSLDYTECSTDSQGYCYLNLNINKTIPGPVYFYYEIRNFYMNHRDFVKSRSFPQLRGENIYDYSRCEGAKYNKDIIDSKFVNPWGMKLNPESYANPCGLIAKSYFNDSEYTLTSSNGQSILIDEKNIANYYDLKYMFKRHPDYKTTQWTDVENEHFIVWMQMESFQNFRKLWGKIPQELRADNYTLKVKNSYNITKSNGKKLVVFTNISPIGVGSFYGYILLLSAGIFFVILIFFTLMKFKNEGKVYTVQDLKWN